MNDLLLRRRAMMERKSDVLNTSPRIVEYGACCDRNNTGIRRDTPQLCYTEWYDVNPVSSSQRRMAAAGVPDSSSYTFQTQTASGGGNWDYFQNRPYLHANAAKIRFTLVTSQLANCYVYCIKSGQIFFAGKNTPYYGYTNIKDMPQG